VTSAAETIRQHRTNAGMSLADVAAILGVTEGAVSQWETGRTSPRRATAIKLDGALSAGGKILEALGYVTPAIPPDVNRIVAAIEELAIRVEELEVHVRELRAWQEGMQ